MRHADDMGFSEHHHSEESSLYVIRQQLSDIRIIAIWWDCVWEERLGDCEFVEQSID